MARISGKDLFGNDLTEGKLLAKDKLIVKLPYIVENIEYLQDGLNFKVYHEPSDVRGIGRTMPGALADFEKNYVDAYKAQKIKKVKDFEVKAEKKKDADKKKKKAAEKPAKEQAKEVKKEDKKI